ncbi:MAG: peptide deformylase [Candidatus Microthrix sp.]|nr:peptide deformylase [Candidatus Microthrix sp.]NLH67015.1 peptide deformylase [Candidatus Microthrix parvicella]MBK7321487.1 peptide deformylase [Candidatus Microthrix sp.]MBL0205701.1 peptide deformylase [Candidatus Microthrix sp.]MBP6133635.1 peptide deformylase [Candidatus Microthrix sp.]
MPDLQHASASGKEKAVSIREVLSIGHPALREVAQDVPLAEVGSAQVQALIDDLVATMRHANGAGLAATQVGEPVRIAVMEVGDNPRYPYKPRIPLTVAINPVIEPLDDEQVVINEGCLSVPLRGEVRRHVNVRVRYLDRDGAEHDEVIRGLTAATWQHECDHLDGVLFIDKVDDPATLSTWDTYEAFHRDAFVERITAFVARVGS